MSIGTESNAAVLEHQTSNAYAVNFASRCFSFRFHVATGFRLLGATRDMHTPSCHATLCARACYPSPPQSTVHDEVLRIATVPPFSAVVGIMDTEHQGQTVKVELCSIEPAAGCSTRGGGREQHLGAAALAKWRSWQLGAAPATASFQGPKLADFRETERKNGIGSG